MIVLKGKRKLRNLVIESTYLYFEVKNVTYPSAQSSDSHSFRPTHIGSTEERTSLPFFWGFEKKYYFSLSLARDISLTFCQLRVPRVAGSGSVGSRMLVDNSEKGAILVFLCLQKQRLLLGLLIISFKISFGTIHFSFTSMLCHYCDNIVARRWHDIITYVAR